jgi:hypothetical protein
LLRDAVRGEFSHEKTEYPIFQTEQRFVNLSSLPIEKKELPGMSDDPAEQGGQN